jgi:hypothetical protein
MARRAGARREQKEKKGGALQRCAPLKGCTRRWPRAVETVGGNGGRSRGWTRRRPPLSERTQPGPRASVRIMGLTGGSHVVLIFFQFIQNWLNFKKSKGVSYLAPKIRGIDSTFESLMNFKRDLNLLKKSGKFPKILS